MRKLAMIGCGGIGGYHLSNFLKLEEGLVDIVGFCDLIPERAEAFAKKAGKGKVFTDYKKMYDEVKPDMVFICVPPYKHGELDFETIERGIHLFVEKPIALDLDLAKKIRDKIAEKNLVSAVGFQLRYDSLTCDIKNFVNNNNIITAQVSRISGVPTVDWWRKRELSGGQLVEMSIHQMDLLRYFLGDVETVYSVPTTGFIKDSDIPGYDMDDVSTSVFTFNRGITGTMITGCYDLESKCGWDSKITLGSTASTLDFHVASDVKIHGTVNEEIRSAGDYGVKCDRTFIEAVISGDTSKIRSPYCDAVKTLAFVLGCNESMKTGLPVKINI